MNSSSTFRSCVATCTLFLLALESGACGDPPTDFPHNTIAPSPVSRPFAVDFSPRALFGGSLATGSVTLSAPAPSGGLLVTLSSTHQAVVPPRTLTIPAGASSASFALATQTVADDVVVSIEASGAGGSRTGSLSVWALLPQFFSWLSDPPASPGGQIGRRTAANAKFFASCYGSTVGVSAEAGFEYWSVDFGATPGQPLRAGVYDNVPIRSAFSGPSFDVNVGVSTPCSTPTGRFVVNDIEVRDGGVVVRLWASFEARCGGTTYLRGDVRAIDAPTSEVGRPVCFH